MLVLGIQTCLACSELEVDQTKLSFVFSMIVPSPSVSITRAFHSSGCFQWLNVCSGHCHFLVWGFIWPVWFFCSFCHFIIPNLKNPHPYSFLLGVGVSIILEFAYTLSHHLMPCISHYIQVWRRSLCWNLFILGSRVAFVNSTDFHFLLLSIIYLAQLLVFPFSWEGDLLLKR